MLHQLTRQLDNILGLSEVSAHCDIPCKIYDPSGAQIAALTIIRMVDLIEEINQKEALTVKDHAQLIRLVSEKEAHGIKVKQEIAVIWGDYFKQPQFDQVQGVSELVHTIMLQASKAKQGIAREDALALLNSVNEFAQAFWLTKGVPVYQATCPYPPAEVVIYPKLSA
ncbi:superoxide dismutase, Ni [Motilimonas pumila]|uniref:Superoxide dismutase, Ni n=1 Tax=Motilimonas pumila TaxID=2303987 RepID=A0A418YAI4_9GAMM|nr:superoxide dismutase, Ni [Motilimonas pumila]RJG39540.1 superoxide dismutase, Ni [Motilimonas pumila]